MHDPISIRDIPGPHADEAFAASREIARREEARAVVRTQQKLVLRVLGARRVAITPEQIETILGCCETATLDLWIDRAGTATTAAEVLGD